MPKVFISYSSTDERLASKLAAVLDGIGLEYFLDRKDVQWGERIVDRISQGLNDCSDIVVVLSPASLKSQWVAFEVGQAKALGKRLLPIVTHPSLDIPDFLRGIHYVRSVAEARRHFRGVAVLKARSVSGQRHPATTPVSVPSGAFTIEPVFWLAQSFVAFAASKMELAFKVFNSQAESLGVAIDRDQIDTSKYGFNTQLKLAAMIEGRHGELARTIFDIGYLVSILPFSFGSRDTLRETCATIEGLALRKLPVTLPTIAKLTANVPSDIPVFVENVELLKKHLQDAVDKGVVTLKGIGLTSHAPDGAAES